MIDRLIKLIDEEDAKNPLTDDEIAISLNILRETVTNIRKECQIPDSRERRKKTLTSDMKEILTEQSDISERGLTKILNDRGYVIGKYAVGKMKEEILLTWNIPNKDNDNKLEAVGKDKTSEGKNKIAIENKISSTENKISSTENKISSAENESAEGYGKSITGNRKNSLGNRKTAINNGKPDNIFSTFIGYNGSMKNQISRAQAAILYPPNGLHTLIYGPSGVGKSLLAEIMYQYAITTDNFEKDAPFFQFNCADYADNPQLLLAQLFGYSKGAFTGATEHKKGIVELCDGGILFLDEVHRLPPEGQEILFYLMDKGKFRRLGEVDTQRESKVMVIAATTENPQSSLLLTFRRRIPMIIEIPSLKERPINEKIQFINQFFQMEARRLGKEIWVKEDVIKCLAGNESPGNVGQLKSDIQVCCAKAFLESKMKQTERISVELYCLAESMKKEYQKEKVSKEINTLVHGEVYFSPEENNLYPMNDFKEGWDIYDKLESKYEQLKKDGMEESEMEEILSGEIESSFFLHIKEVEESRFSIEEIANIVGEEVLNITKDIYELAKKKLPLLESSLIFPLAIHMNMAIDRMKMKVRAIRSGMKNIRDLYPEDYKIAEEIIQEIKKKYYIEINDEEIGFLVMYFRKFQKQGNISQGKIGVLVVSHGHVACGMAEVANVIMGENHAVGLETDFKDTPQEMAGKVVQAVRQIDQGKGCIILADMGSLMTIKDRIQQETGIKVGIVGRTDTIMVIECIRKALWTDEDIDTIIEDLDVKNTITTSYKKINQPKENAIICLCITGEGAARNIKTHLQNQLSANLDSIQILTKGYIEDSKIENIIGSIEDRFNILAIVGTIDPKVKKYPFFSIYDVYQSNGIMNLRKILKTQTMSDRVDLGEVINSENILINPNFHFKDEIIDYSIQKLIDQGNVKSEFLLSVYKREGLMTTFLKGGIAIPHGDTELVTKPAIFITKLVRPVSWDGTNTVDVVFVLALNEDSKKYFEHLYKIISDESMISSIRNSNSTEEILKILSIHTESVR